MEITLLVCHADGVRQTVTFFGVLIQLLSSYSEHWTIEGSTCRHSGRNQNGDGPL